MQFILRIQSGLALLSLLGMVLVLMSTTSNNKMQQLSPLINYKCSVGGRKHYVYPAIRRPVSEKI